MQVRRWFRFSLATLLFVTFCLSGFFAGYHYGHIKGTDAGWLSFEGESRQVYSLDVGDILPSPGDSERFHKELRALLKQLGWTWSNPGEGLTLYNARIMTGRKGVWIEVVDTIKHHNAVEALLSEIRQRKRVADSQGRSFSLTEQ